MIVRRRETFREDNNPFSSATKMLFNRLQRHALRESSIIALQVAATSKGNPKSIHSLKDPGLPKLHPAVIYGLRQIFVVKSSGGNFLPRAVTARIEV